MFMKFMGRVGGLGTIDWILRVIQIHFPALIDMAF